jgi:hypothetical protein
MSSPFEKMENGLNNELPKTGKRSFYPGKMKKQEDKNSGETAA